MARGLALLAMALYHFTWDLDNFGYVERGLATTGGWKIFARCIASSFLVLVGIGLVLAHSRGIRWRPFLLRLGQVAAGALAITVVTYFATPESYVFFGILHHIALASLLGLAALRLPWFATALLAALVVALPFAVSTTWTEPAALAWIGFAAKIPVTNDFVPVFPWFGAVLAGMALAQLGLRTGAFDRLRAANPGFARARPLAFLGRHSLVFYLLHQPLLFGLVMLATHFVPPDRAVILESDCKRSLYFGEESPARCAPFAACTVSELDAVGLLDLAFAGNASPEEDEKIQSVVQMCQTRP
ncbi:hypothetical protein ASG54_08995 [Aureimonas sp. Leaf460]|nr:hypothetical protein ASG62_06400 [Aureimonas sp. Leaf427]KQT79170.1 hypothetical protein ASG54_08995 [Aureimonas sp. Leaf460]